MQVCMYPHNYVQPSGKTSFKIKTTYSNISIRISAFFFVEIQSPKSHKGLGFIQFFRTFFFSNLQAFSFAKKTRNTSICILKPQILRHAIQVRPFTTRHVVEKVGLIMHLIRFVCKDRIQSLMSRDRSGVGSCG